MAGRLGTQKSELYARLRGLRERAEKARKIAGQPWSQSVLQGEVRASGLPGAAHFTGKRASDWAPADIAKFKVPVTGSDDALAALVAVWSRWAGERVDSRWWRGQLERVREEEAREDVFYDPGASGFVEETIEQAGPAKLEIHQAALPQANTRNAGTGSGQALELTPYLARSHDCLLHQVLVRALDGGPSVLVILTGESSTGKTRALYEALLRLAPGRLMLRPADADDLVSLLDSGRLTAGKVLWLNEAQRFLNGSNGERAAAKLRRELEKQPGVVAVGTMWTDPYWSQFTRSGLEGDPHAHARALLTHSGFAVRIPVAPELSDGDLARWRDYARPHRDRRLIHAVQAGAADGKVVQHLSGGPELLTAYLAGPGHLFTRPEHALITAALAGRGMGHRSPLPSALLADAADSILEDRHRPADPAWATEALQALVTGIRADGSCTDIRGTLTALTALRPLTGAEVLYEPADYLVQHVPGPGTSQLDSNAFWFALIRHTTDSSDLDIIARIAWRNNRRKQAVRLWRAAVLAGNSDALRSLSARLSESIGLDQCAARWIAAHADISAPGSVADLLEILRTSAADEAAQILLSRNPAAQVNLTSLLDVARLIRLLHQTGGDYAAASLAHRAAAQADLTRPYNIAHLQEALREIGAAQDAESLTRRAAIQVTLTDTSHVADLLTCLHQIGAVRDAESLTRRAVAEIVEPVGIASLLDKLHSIGAAQAPGTLAHWATQVEAVTPGRVAALLDGRRTSGAAHIAVTLAHWAAPQVDVIRPGGVTHLLSMMRKIGAVQDARVLADRAADQVDLTDPEGVAHLLDQMREIGADQAAQTLLSRNPGAHVDTTRPWGVARLLSTLHEAGLHQAAAALAERGADQVDLTDPGGVAHLLDQMREIGADQAAQTLLSRNPGAHARLANMGNPLALHLERAYTTRPGQSMSFEPAPWGVIRLLDTLRKADAGSDADALAHRAATKVDLTDPQAVAYLLDGFHKIKSRHGMQALLDRNPAAHVNLTNSDSIALLFFILHEVGAEIAIQTLLNRYPITHFSSTFGPDNPELLLNTLFRIGAGQTAQTIAYQLAADADLMDEESSASIEDVLRKFGAEKAAQLLSHRAVMLSRQAKKTVAAAQESEPYGLENDGIPAQPWTWNTLFPEEGSG